MIAGAGVLAALGLWEIFKKPSKAGLGAPRVTGSATIKGPGETQPSDKIVAQPKAPRAVADQLHDVAAALLQRAAEGLNESDVSPEVSAFQASYNAVHPVTPLHVDGRYGKKTQAVLQSVIAPAAAPAPLGAARRAPFVAPPSPKAAAPSSSASDINGAVNGVLRLFSDRASQGSFSEVTAFQNAWNALKADNPLVANGIYNPKTEAALNAVLAYVAHTNNMSTGQAPPNAYGPALETLSFP